MRREGVRHDARIGRRRRMTRRSYNPVIRDALIRMALWGHYWVTWILLPHRDCELRMKVPAPSVVWKT